MKKIDLKNKKGFSLVEILVSMAVLTLGLATIMSLMISSMRQSNEAKNQMFASGLAEEGIELVLNLKEREDLTYTDIPSNNYSIDTAYTKDNFLGSTATTRQLYLPNGLPKFYTHSSSSATATIFYRQINVDNTVVDQIKVTSFVSWNSAGIPASSASCTVANKCVSVTSIMLDK